jgi:hypothetical protein
MQRFVYLAVLALGGCGGLVVVEADGLEPVQDGSATTGSAGIGGAAGTGSSTSSLATGGTGGSEVTICDESIVEGSIWVGEDVVDDNYDPLLHSSCFGSWGQSLGAESGNAFLASQDGATMLRLEVCDGPSDTGFPMLRLEVELDDVGYVEMGRAFFATSDSESYSTDAAVTMTITEFPPIGGIIRGEYTATVEAAGMGTSKEIAGWFGVCHVAGMPQGP